MPRRILAGLAIAVLAAFSAAPCAAQAGFDVFEKSITELQAAQAAGQVTSVQLVRAYLARIQAYDAAGPRLNAVLRLNPRAEEEAAALDRERAAKGPRGPLHGVPVLVKDNYNTVGMPTSGGALALATLQPASDAFQVARLKQAGAVILGKTTLHELAAGITNISSLSGATRNPYHLDRVPGGSSGGTAAAVAAGLAAAGMGSDTCGSIRIPAANQNLVGLRPTMGLSSRAGIVPLSASQDVAGPLARSVQDLALMLDATVGPDPADASTRAGAGRIPASYAAGLRTGALQGARLGVVRSLFGKDPDDAETTAVVQKALDALKARGAEVVDVVVPDLDAWLRDSSTIAHEFKFDLADYLAAQPGAPVRSLGDILKRGLHHEQLDATLRLRDTPVSRDTEAARKTLAQRQGLSAAVAATFQAHRLDALLYPALQRKPAFIGEPQRGANCQLSASTGLPAIVVPVGFTADGAPTGLELLGPAFTEEKLLGMAYDWEAAQRPRKPPYSTPRLVDGQAPGVRRASLLLEAVPGSLARVSLAWDPLNSVLDYAASLGGVQPGDELIAIALHRAAAGAGAGAPGPVIGHLLRRGQAAQAAQLKLHAQDREALEAGRLSLALYTALAPLGGAPVQVRLVAPQKP